MGLQNISTAFIWRMESWKKTRHTKTLTTTPPTETRQATKPHSGAARNEYCAEPAVSCNQVKVVVVVVVVGVFVVNVVVGGVVVVVEDDDDERGAIYSCWLQTFSKEEKVRATKNAPFRSPTCAETAPVSSSQKL
jgi:hypothetical protein